MTTARSGASPRPSALQFRLGTALIAMIAVAFACAGLVRPTPFWAGLLLLLALLSLVANLLVAIYRTDSARAFAVGFLIFGGGYLACTLLLDRSLHRDGEAAMPTGRVALWVFWRTHAQFRRTVSVTPGSFGGGGGMGTGAAGMPPAPTVIQVPVYLVAHFVEAVHSVLIVLLGIIGGLFGRFLFLTSPQRTSDEVRREVLP